MQTIVPCLFFDGKAEEAVNFYKSVFKNAKVGHISRYGNNMPMPKGSVMTAELEIAGQKFLALNGPPMFSFSPAISFMVNCETQQEIDYYWDKLSEGGETGAERTVARRTRQFATIRSIEKSHDRLLPTIRNRPLRCPPARSGGQAARPDRVPPRI